MGLHSSKAQLQTPILTESQQGDSDCHELSVGGTICGLGPYS